MEVRWQEPVQGFKDNWQRDKTLRSRQSATKHMSSKKCSTWPQAPSLEEILDKRASTPYSHSDFEAFLKPTDLHYLLQLWDALQIHEQVWLGYCRHNEKSMGRTLAKEKWIGVEIDEPIVLLSDVREVASRINFMYLVTGSPYDVNMPPQLTYKLAQALSNHRPCDPSLLEGVRSQLFSRLVHLHPHFINSASTFNLTLVSSLLNGAIGALSVSLALAAAYAIIFIYRLSREFRLTIFPLLWFGSVLMLASAIGNHPMLALLGRTERHPFRLSRIDDPFALSSHRHIAFRTLAIASLLSISGTLAICLVPDYRA
ncbi:Bud site selection protein, Revert to axial protein 1 [Entomophthora muscae]|uniref:Bud site selection protein, Revert to axial protein 1 n=1 Tax=Entomophthora muscae TaxID=34485 RepID=A0ACC2TSM7_9FUNG|nr:Bud site selection protein, Revert to axial protein 1 [Entomophthora muscae]